MFRTKEKATAIVEMSKELQVELEKRGINLKEDPKEAEGDVYHEAFKALVHLIEDNILFNRNLEPEAKEILSKHLGYLVCGDLKEGDPVTFTYTLNN